MAPPLKPSRDPDAPHPGKLFYGGQWRSPAAVERYRRRHRRPDANSRRVWCGQFYAGYVTRESTARILNEAVRREFRDRKNQSRA